MRMILLVVVEIVAVFGIARAVHEVRATLDRPQPSAALAAVPPRKERLHIPSAPAKPVRAGEVERALLLQVSRLPGGRATCNPLLRATTIIFRPG
jgi:hypothetical protein